MLSADCITGLNEYFGTTTTVDNLNVIFFTKYTTDGASSRYRSYQYFPALAAAGVSVTVFPLLDGDHLAHKHFSGRVQKVNVFFALVRRLKAVLTTPRGSVVCIEYELFPWFPALLERWLVWRGCRLVADYDDALFHQYDKHSNPLVRKLLGKKIATVMQIAQKVCVGNEYLANYARQAGAVNVELVPTVVDLSRYETKEYEQDAARQNPIFTIGWIGSPSTKNYLHSIAPALAEVFKDGSTRLRLIGSGPIFLQNVPSELVNWNESTEVEEMRKFDIGIMPLPDEPWAHGKCGLKLIQYMACALPVVASPIGVNAKIVTEGVNGHLASTIEEWVQAINNLKTDYIARQRMGMLGRQRVEDQYCLQVTAPKWIAILQSLKSD